MSENFKYWTSVSKRILGAILAILCVLASFKLVVFYLPFLIAFIISLVIEPWIRWIMKKIKLSRRVSAIIIFFITFGLIIALLSFGIGNLISESTNLLNKFNDYYSLISTKINDFIKATDFSRFKIPTEISQLLQDASSTALERVSEWVQKFLSRVLSIITSIPTYGVYFGITILSLYFICTDKIYMLDELEHHLPEKWMKKISKHLREIIKTLGEYLKAQIKLIVIAFIICLIGLYIFHFLRIKCGVSFINCFVNWICRCPPNFGFREYNDSMGYYFRLKWRFEFRYLHIDSLDYYDFNKAIYRAKDCEWKYRNSSDFYYYCNVYGV